jgi:hypothetical protein
MDNNNTTSSHVVTGFDLSNILGHEANESLNAELRTKLLIREVVYKCMGVKPPPMGNIVINITHDINSNDNIVDSEKRHIEVDLGDPFIRDLERQYALKGRQCAAGQVPVEAPVEPLVEPVEPPVAVCPRTQHANNWVANNLPLENESTTDYYKRYGTNATQSGLKKLTMNAIATIVKTHGYNISAKGKRVWIR